MLLIINFFKRNYILISIILLSIALRFYHVDYQSLWLDEIHTVIESNPSLSLPETFEALYASDPHPPLYFLFIKGLFSLFGSSSLVARGFSALLGVLGVWAIYLLGKELYGKKTGLYAALLLSVNYFHIFYSQDARPYPLLFLTTTISFFFLVKFIRTPSVKSALLYGAFAGVMLYTHLFSLFVLFSQCVILLYFVCWPYKEITTRKKFFLYCLLAGVITGVMYIPCLKTLLIASQRTSMWIPAPEADVYVHLFKEFFGYSKNLTWMIGLLLVIFFGKLLVGNKNSSGNKLSDAFNFGAFILLLWIITVLVLAFVRSYLSLPVIVSRYFISVLPALILITAMGLSTIKSRFLQFIFISIFVALSLINIIIEQKYYEVKTKTEFREATNFIIDNNKDNTPVVTSLAWHMSFFLNNEKVSYPIIDNSLDAYTKEMMADSTAIKPFWYIDGHLRPYTPSKEVRQFLEDKFYIESNFEGFDIWTRLYVPKKIAKGININKFGQLKVSNGDAINYVVKEFTYAGNELKISGYSCFPDQDISKSRIDLVLIKKDTIIYRLPTINDFRIIDPNDKFFNGGFASEYNTSNLEPGEYRLGIYMNKKLAGKEGLVITDKTIVKQ